VALPGARGFEEEDIEESLQETASVVCDNSPVSQLPSVGKGNIRTVVPSPCPAVSKSRFLCSQPRLFLGRYPAE